MKKTYATEVVLSATTGILLCEFGDMHELIEHIIGHPVWTHELADRSMMDVIREDVCDQHPRLREVDKSQIINGDWATFRDKWIAKLGATLDIESWNYIRSETPLDSLKRIAPGATSLAVLSQKRESPKGGE